MGELGADLVRPTGDQLALHQRKPPRACEGFVIGLAGLAAGLGRVRDVHPVFLGVLEEIPFQAPLFGLGAPFHLSLIHISEPTRP